MKFKVQFPNQVVVDKQITDWRYCFKKLDVNRTTSPCRCTLQNQPHLPEIFSGDKTLDKDYEIDVEDFTNLRFQKIILPFFLV